MRRVTPHFLRQSFFLALALSFASCTNENSMTQPPVQGLYTTPTGLLTANPPQILVGAGDIASCGKNSDEATALLVDNIPGTVMVLGDNVYENGTTSEFNNCYHPTWGRHKARTKPATGNHEYNSSGAAPYYAYFGAAAGIAGQGYYSYDLGAWHIIVLNSSISRSAGSPQDTWLQNDLAAHPNLCTLSYFHHPLYSSEGGSGSGGVVYSGVRRPWDVMYPAGVDLVLGGHRHFYERMAPMKPDGTADPVTGIREIIVGSGGIGGGDLTNIFPTSEVREGRTFGVLKLYLYDDSYAWKFIPVAGKTFTDSGSTACHGPPGGGGGGGVSASQSTVAASPASFTAGSGSSTVTVTAKNSSGSPISGASVVVSASGTGNTLTLSSGSTNGSGVFTSTLTSTGAGAKTVSATANGIAITQTAPVTVSTAPAAALAFTAPPTNTAAGQAISPAVLVEIRDQFGNLTSATNSVAMAIGTNPAGGTLSGTTSVAAVNGVATFSTLNINKAGNGYTLSATSGTLTVATSTSFNITPTTATQLAFTQQPSNATAGVAVTPAVKVTALDGSGNIAAGFTGAVSLSVAGGPSGATLTGATANAVAGVATFTTLSVNKAGTGYTLSALSGALTGPPSTAFDVGPAAASKLVFSQQPSNATAGAAISPTVAVIAQDQFGNTATSFAGLVTLAITSGTGTPDAVLSGKTATAASGAAIFPALSIDKAGAGYTLSATATGTTGATSTAFSVSAGAASQLVFTQQPSNGTTGAAISPAVKVTALDGFGNVATGFTGSVSLTIASGPAGAALSDGSASAQTGVATFSTLSLDMGGTYSLAASSNGLSGATSNSLTMTDPVVATQLAFTVQPSNATTGAAISPAVRVTAQSASGSVATNFTGSVSVTIATGPAGAALSGATATAVNGVATFTTLSADHAGTYTLAASATGPTGTTSNSFAVTDPIVPTQLAFTGQPSNAVAGAAISPAVQVEIRDQFGNRTSATNSVTMAIGTNPASGILTGTLTVAAVNGVATFSTLKIDKAGAGYTLQATAAGLTGATSTAFNVTAPPPGSSQVLVGAGNIAECSAANDEATAAILDTIPGTVFTPGNNMIGSGSLSVFTTCYGPSWGRHKPRTRPAVGWQEYKTPGAAGYWQYFGAATGDSGKYYYSYDLGSWHIIVLNDQWKNAPINAGSPQETWLRADLATTTQPCIMALWSQPRFSSSQSSPRSVTLDAWRDLYAAGADVVVNGDFVNYERFAPQTPDGAADPVGGIRQFVVGTGGRVAFTSFTTAAPNSEVRNNNTYGVMKFTLGAGSYSWQFVPVGGSTFTDSGSGNCH